MQDAEQRAARGIGGLLIGFTVLSLAHYLSVEPPLLDGDPVAFLSQHPGRMRVSIVHDLSIFILVAVLGVCAYRGLRRFGAGLALFGLVAMGIEAAGPWSSS